MPTATKTRLTQQQFDAIARAVADPRRFAILKQVAANPCMGCSALHEHAELAPATISHHMKELHDAGLIEIIREGRTASLELRRDTWQAYLDRLSSL